MTNEFLQKQTRERMFQDPGIPARWICWFHEFDDEEVPCTTARPHKNIWCQFYSEDELQELHEKQALDQLDEEIPRPDIVAVDEVRRKMIEEQVKAYEDALLVLAGIT